MSGQQTGNHSLPIVVNNSLRALHGQRSANCAEISEPVRIVPAPARGSGLSYPLILTGFVNALLAMPRLKTVKRKFTMSAFEDSERLRIVAIIQARMGSTRLPGKVLRPIAGEPLLWDIVTRLRCSHLIEEVAVATTTDPRDDAIVEFCESRGITAVRGPEDDVLARFARAAEVLEADIIVRVSSDAPFIDADFVDHLVASMIEQSGDYVLLADGSPTTQEGVDPFTRRALDKLMMDARHDPVAREHVTSYFRQHPEFVKIARAAPYPPLVKKGARPSVDTPDDLAFAEAVRARPGAKAGEVSLADLLLLEREPPLSGLRTPVKRKPGTARGNLALIVCNGGGKFGYGHVKRMTVLARALRDRNGIASVFAMSGSTEALEPIQRAGFEAVGFSHYEFSQVMKLVEARSPDLVIVDCREGPSRAELTALKTKVSSVVVIDDGNERRLAADRAYYPPVPQSGAMNWAGSMCERRIGWEWSLLGLSPTGVRVKPHGSRQTLLVTMGGSDPLHLTERCALALAKIDPVFRVRFVIGPGVANKDIASHIARLSPSFETVEGASDLATEFASADATLVAFGVTAYELAAFGVPAIYLSLTPDHALSASAFEKAGMGISLGVAKDLADEAIVRAVRQLLGDAGRRRAMRRAGLMTVDGQGAGRVAADIAELISSRRAARVERDSILSVMA
jgi:spore coat polysaccharide biosynthesis protein SpsF